MHKCCAINFVKGYNIFQAIYLSFKGGIEKNHEFIRYALPKKTTFKDLTQNNCNIIANHINSLCRESLNNNSPFKAMSFLCDETVLNMYYIEPDEVQLNKIKDIYTPL